MKRSNILIALLIIAAVMPSCRKGEEDPALSLLSRKARLTGEWKVTDYQWSANSTDEKETYSETLRHQDGNLSGSMTLLNESQEVNSSLSGEVTKHTFKFESDGTYTHSFYREMMIHSGSEESPLTVEEYESGTWSFLTETKNARSKEIIALTPENTTYIHTDNMGVLGEEKRSAANNESKNYRLIRLANDEIVMESERGSSTYLVTFGNENEVGHTVSETFELRKQ